MTSAAWMLRAMPGVFVVIWSTGFIVARFGMPHAGPMAFLSVRYLLSALAFGVWVAVVRARWPRSGTQVWHLVVTGLLMQAGYLGGVWAAVKAGMGAGLVALIVGLQPVLTALWLGTRSGPGPRVGGLQWLGLGLGLAGLLLVVGDRLQIGQARPLNLALALLALGSITAGTLYQKRWVQPCDVRSAGLVQMLAALAVTAPLALLESAPFDLHAEVLWAMAWSVLVLTLGGSSLLYLLIQRGAAAEVTSLMYLVPPCTAVMAWGLFGESLSTNTVVGLAVTAAGVAVVVRGARPAVP